MTARDQQLEGNDKLYNGLYPSGFYSRHDAQPSRMVFAMNLEQRTKFLPPTVDPPIRLFLPMNVIEELFS